MRERHERSDATVATASRAPPPPSPPRRPPWRKVLWARQEGYGDEHTSETFLEELVVNATVPQRDYSTVVWSSLVVDQQLATVAAVGAASHHLYRVREKLSAGMGAAAPGSCLLQARDVRHCPGCALARMRGSVRILQLLQQQPAMPRMCRHATAALRFLA